MSCLAVAKRLSCSSAPFTTHRGVCQTFRRQLWSAQGRAQVMAQPFLESTQTPAAVQDDAVTASIIPEGDYAVQYVLLRRDLWVEKGWPLGSVVAQACHATAAVIAQNLEDEVTKFYISSQNLGKMAKVVLEVKDEAQLRKVSEKLAEAGIIHSLWIEQPENIPTSIATKPYPKSVVGQHVKKFQLCKTKLLP